MQRSTTRWNFVYDIRGKTSETIIVGAHYDCQPTEGLNFGINDNKTGVELVLEILESLLRRGTQPNYSYRFLLFGSEEAGYLGML
ncbi:unnamed protein product, partial [marine sediment metagenome]